MAGEGENLVLPAELRVAVNDDVRMQLAVRRPVRRARR